MSFPSPVCCVVDRRARGDGSGDADDIVACDDDGLGGDDVINAAAIGTNGPNLILDGGNGADVLIGSGGNDTILGGAGDVWAGKARPGCGSPSSFFLAWAD